MTKNFNWNYDSAHELGHSHVRDQRDDYIARKRELREKQDQRVAEKFASDDYLTKGM